MKKKRQYFNDCVQRGTHPMRREDDDALYCVLCHVHTRLTPPSRKTRIHTHTRFFFAFSLPLPSFFLLRTATIFVTNKFCSCLQCSIYSEFDSIFFFIFHFGKPKKREEKKKKEKAMFRNEEIAYFILCVSCLVLCLFILHFIWSGR